MRALRIRQLRGIGDSGALEANIALPAGPAEERPVAASGTVRFNSSLQTVELYDGQQWRTLVAAGEVRTTGLFQGRGTPSQPLDLNLEQLAQAGGFLRQVYTDNTLQGQGTEADPLRVNIAALPTTGGLLQVNCDNTLLGAGTAANPLRVNETTLATALTSYQTEVVSSTRAFRREDAGRHLVVISPGVSLSVPQAFPFSNGQVVKVTNKAGAGSVVTLQGVRRGTQQTLHLYEGDTVLLVSDGEVLVAVTNPRGEARGLRPVVITSSRSLTRQDAGTLLLVTGAASQVTLTADSSSFLPGHWLQVCNQLDSAEGRVILQGVAYQGGSSLTLRKGQSAYVFRDETALRASRAYSEREFVVPQLPVKVITTSYTVGPADAGHNLVCNSAQDIAITLPDPLPYGQGTFLGVTRRGGGAVAVNYRGTVVAVLGSDGSVMIRSHYADTGGNYNYINNSWVRLRGQFILLVGGQPI